ncbi:unnamed protein product [Rotaria socialis]|uniref:Uncharacterized protein n=1 Tax=Rotaria socialis TaxID=392032 RepID=A0A818S5P8_9BILA|nr:unnamed protein product [Rotaria socialis]
MKKLLEKITLYNKNLIIFLFEHNYQGADEWLFKPKVIEGPLDTVTYTLDGVPLFEGHRRAWRVTKEGATAEATVTSEEIEEEEENQDPGREIPHRVR